jgi:hypothetical protein
VDDQRPTETNEPERDDLPSDTTRTGDVDVELPAASGLGDLGAPADDPAPGGADAPGVTGIGTGFGGGGTLGMPGGVGLPDEGDRRP